MALMKHVLPETGMSASCDGEGSGPDRISDLPDEALFSFEKILNFATVALSFLFDKYCPIMN